MRSLPIPVSVGAIGPFERFSPLQLSEEFLHWAVVFSVIANSAAVVGARGVAGVTMTVAKWFVILFFVLTIISMLL